MNVHSVSSTAYSIICIYSYSNSLEDSGSSLYHRVDKLSMQKKSREQIKSYINKCKYAAAAKSLQSCPTLCDPIDGSPPGSPVTGILQARTLEWVAISFSSAWKWSQSCLTLSDPMDCSLPGSSAHGISQARVLEWGAIAFSKYRNNKCSINGHALVRIGKRKLQYFWTKLRAICWFCYTVLSWFSF